jgi:hypothetical protein
MQIVKISNFSDSASTNLRDVGIGIPQKNSSINEEKKQQAPKPTQQQQHHQNQQPSNYDKSNSKEDLNNLNSLNESNNKSKPPPYIPPPKVSSKSPDKPNIVNPDDLLIKDLIQLIKLQREKIINQQNDLSKVSETFLLAIDRKIKCSNFLV